jgi:hypothetical protein
LTIGTPTGESTVWVQVPALSGTNTSIWAYWGNPMANTTPPPGTNVWVPQPWEGLPAYDVVYHLKESSFPFADAAGTVPGELPAPRPRRWRALSAPARSFTSSPYP